MYRVYLEDKEETVSTKEEAETIALNWAMDLWFDDEESELGEPEVYGGPDENDNWGACPQDHDGSYYPHIKASQ